MQKLSPQAYKDLTRDSRLLAEDSHGEKVLQRQDGLVIKLFRRKRLLSSAALRPYALRFQRNSEGLRKRDVNTVQVSEVYRCPSIQRDIVTYQYVEGRMLRDAIKQANPQLVQRFAAFIAELHRKGVYFRSMHLGNVLLLPDGRFALIDVADMSLRPWSLGLWKRLRNFAHLLRYEDDTRLLLRYDFNAFLQSYLANSGMGMLRRSMFTIFLLRRHRYLMEHL
jgi:hypothetical protein